MCMYKTSVLPDFQKPGKKKLQLHKKTASVQGAFFDNRRMFRDKKGGSGSLELAVRTRHSRGRERKGTVRGAKSVMLSKAEATYGLLLMLLHLVDNVGSLRQGECCGHTVPHGGTGRNQGIAHQCVNTVRRWSVVWAVDPTVVVVIAVIAKRGCNVVIVQDQVLVDFHHTRLPGW